MVSEKAAVCVHVQKGYEGLLPCVRACAAVALGRVGGGDGEWREESAVARRSEWRVMRQCQHVCETSHEDGLRHCRSKMEVGVRIE